MAEQVQEQEVKAEEVKAEEVNPLIRKVELQIAQADAMAAAEKALKKYAKDAKMPGFRKGHVPMSHVRSMYGARAFEDAVNELLGEEWRKVVASGEYKIVAAPEMVPVEGKEEGKMVFEARFEVFPEVEMPAFADLELKRFVCPVGEAEVNKTIDVMRRQRATFEAQADRAAQDGDLVTLDFKGVKDGEAFQGGTAENYKFELGQGRMLPEFEEAVKGMKAGEEKTFPLTFPADYGVPALNGATVEFTVTIKAVEVARLPELDDEFAKSLGVESAEAMRKEILQNLEREVNARLEQHNKGFVMNAVVDVLKFPLPTALVAEEQQTLAQQAVQNMAARGVDVKKIDMSKLPLDVFKDQAARRVRMGLFMNKLLEENTFEVAEEEIRALAQSIASSYEDPAEVVEYIMNDANRSGNLRAQIMEEKVTAWIYEQSKTTEETVDFDKLMAGNF